MKNLFLAIIGVLGFLANEANAQITMDTNGDWNLGTNWVGNTAAGVGDDAFIDGGGGTDATVVSSDDITVNTLVLGNNSTITIDATGKLTIDNLGSDAFVTNNGAEITVDGDLTINGNLVANNNLILNVTGTLIIDGDVVLKNGAELTFDPGSSTSISGNLTAGTGTILNIDAPVTVGGDLDIQSGTITGTAGNLTVEGDCIGAECGSAVLPIELYSFNVMAKNSGVEVLWSTASEENFDYFTVERSGDGFTFEGISTVSGNGNSQERIDYSFMDNNPLLGLSYYRLTATDLDGTFEVFDIAGVNYEGNFESKIYPNPCSSNNLFVQMNDNQETAHVTIHNLSGELVFGEELTAFSSQISLPGNIENGIYLVTVSNSSTSQKQRLVLNR